jgi:acyl-CoA dehydrogenase
MSEPDAGSDVGAIRTTARKRPDGGYVIDGRKWFIGNGARAEWVTVFANVAPDRGQFGLRIFVVHRGTPGFRVGRVLPTMGLKALQVSELVFEECGVPEDAVLEIAGRKGEAGIQAALKTFSCFRPAVAATAMGVARAAIDMLEQLVRQNGARHAQARQWRAVAQRIDEMRAEVEAVRSLVWRAAARHDEGKGNEREASMAKVMGADVVLRICAEIMELAGAAGATDELPFERLFRDAVAFDMLEGTGDIHRLMVARALTRMGRS